MAEASPPPLSYDSQIACEPRLFSPPAFQEWTVWTEKMRKGSGSVLSNLPVSIAPFACPNESIDRLQALSRPRYMRAPSAEGWGS